MTIASTLAETLAEICVMEAPLWRRLELYVAKQRELGSPFVAASDALVARLRAGDAGRNAPEVGDPMPDFLLPDRAGRLRGLADFLADGPLILSFNRGHWCPFCRIELDALAASHEDFLALGARVISIMPDRQAFVGRLPARVRERITVLSDIDAAYALSLGLVMWLGDDLTGLMRAGGLDLTATHGNSLAAVPIPATFVIGQDGRVAARFVDPDFRHRMELDAIRSALSGLAPPAPH